MRRFSRPSLVSSDSVNRTRNLIGQLLTCTPPLPPPTHVICSLATFARTLFALCLGTQASISTAGVVEIHATFQKKEDLGVFFKTFGNPKALLQTVMSLACAAPKEVKLSVTMSGGMPYSFSSAVKEAAKALAEGEFVPKPHV
jgi:acid phosphatase family membrane protein YuiD